MFKIPGVGQNISEFTSDISYCGCDEIRISISYNIPGKGKNLRTYVVKPDDRSGDKAQTKNTIEKELSFAHDKKIAIREDKQRNYLWIGSKQFTGWRDNS